MTNTENKPEQDEGYAQDNEGIEVNNNANG